MIDRIRNIDTDPHIHTHCGQHLTKIWGWKSLQNAKIHQKMTDDLG